MLKLNFLSSKDTITIIFRLKNYINKVFSAHTPKVKQKLQSVFSLFGRRRLGGRIITSWRITLSIGAMVRIVGFRVGVVEKVAGHEDVHIHQLGNPGIIPHER